MYTYIDTPNPFSGYTTRLEKRMKIRNCNGFAEMKLKVEALFSGDHEDESVFARFRPIDSKLEIQLARDRDLCLRCYCAGCQMCAKFSWLHGEDVSPEYINTQETSWSNLVCDLNKLFDLNHNRDQLVFARFKRDETNQLKIELIMAEDLCTGCGCQDCTWCEKFDWLQGLDVPCND